MGPYLTALVSGWVQMEDNLKMAIDESRAEASEEHNPLDTLISDFQALKLGDSQCLLFESPQPAPPSQPGLWQPELMGS